MARPETRWLLSILLVNLPNCLAPPGPPPPPSPPQCHIPYEEYDGVVLSTQIQCVWAPGPDSQTPTNYSLHWESPDSNNLKGEVVGTNVSGSIHRTQISSHSELRVWVQAENQHGVVISNMTSFNTADIMMPPTPTVTHHYQEPLEIHWKSQCVRQGRSVGDCEVRHRTEADQSWLKEEDGFHGMYPVDNPQPFTVYEFQIRCACADFTDLKSDWSKVYKVKSAETAPVGELDVWRGCGVSSRGFECALMWKTLPRSQACGHILGYELKLSYSNGTVVRKNMTTAKPNGELLCDEVRCNLISPLKGVSAVNVSAYNAHGATLPARLAMPTPGKLKDEQAIHLKMNLESLSVSWDLPSHLVDDLKEYVVQYKQAGLPLAQGFDWVRVNKNQTSRVVKGQFEEYTAYQVSLFTVSHKSNTHHLSTVIGYSLQGIPSKVPSFDTPAVDTTHVTLSWEPIPLLQRKGVILCYQIGVGSQKVYNVSVSQQHENMTYLLEHLSPGQGYEVWIRGVTEAGPGVKAFTTFITKDQEFLSLSMKLMVLATVIVCIAGIAVCFFRVKYKAYPLVPQCCNEKVPDPRNSHILGQMKHQFSDSWAWICVPILEPHPKISQVEVVEIQPQALKSCPEKTSCPDGLTEQVVEDKSSLMDTEGNQRENAVREDEWERTQGIRRCGREDYSKMIDSDEEKDREEDEDDSLGFSEEQFNSGYEKHFMPTALDVMEL